MENIIINILFTSLVFVVFGFALAFVYNNKKNNRCSMCGIKSDKSCIKTSCPSKSR
jgi:hypothetical protein